MYTCSAHAVDELINFEFECSMIHQNILSMCRCCNTSGVVVSKQDLAKARLLHMWQQLNEAVCLTEKITYNVVHYDNHHELELKHKKHSNS